MRRLRVHAYIRTGARRVRGADDLRAIAIFKKWGGSGCPSRPISPGPVYMQVDLLLGKKLYRVSPLLSCDQVQGFEEARREFGRTAVYSGLTHCFRRIVTEEGILAFYKGTAPSIIKVNLLLVQNS